MMLTKPSIKVLLLLSIIVVATSCKQYDNFTTFFNTYYNANKLMNESQDEFAYQDEKKRVMPRIVVPEPSLKLENDRKSGMPPFMAEIIVSKSKRQPVAVKLDSIIIKGSKILAYHPKSNYVQDVLFLMAKTYFYKEEWLPSQIKCSELIDKYPDGDLSPDAHLLLSQNLIIQQKFFAGKIMLSRTVDIAWQKKRYDILSEAFRVEAELALHENDLPAALKPYLQAIAQSDDGLMKAKWQVDMATLLYRLGMFERAEREFANALRYDPDYLSVFEANLYRAACLIRLDRIAEAEKILNRLDNDGKFTDWKAWVHAQRLQIARKSNSSTDMANLERVGDSLYNAHPAINAYAFERAMDLYNDNEYMNARIYFARARASKTMFFNQADQMYQLLNSWDSYKKKTTSIIGRFENSEPLSDTSLQIASNDIYELARIHSRLKNNDSALYYYSLAAKLSPEKDTITAKYIYVLSHYLKDNDLRASDSLLEIVVAKYPRTMYGREAMKSLGYTQAFLQDSVAELYSSGAELMKFGEYAFAVKQFKTLYDKYPFTKFAPRSLYNTGWIYEKHTINTDSALKYYKLLIDNYPETPYAKDVKLSVEFLSIVKSGSAIPDSLKERTQVVYIPKPIPMHGEPIKEAPKKKKEKEGSWEDVFKPKNLLDKAKELISEPVEQIKDLKNIDPKSLIVPSSQDSTNVKQPEIIPENEDEKK